MESQLGFKFQPSDQLIIHFLKEKRLDPHFSHHPIKDIGHICSLEPWDLAMESKTETEDQVWYFFYEPYYKYRESNRAHRKTEAGHWTITSRDSKIEARNGLTGTKKFLTFYRRSPCSKAAAKTDWIMHEYHVKDDPSYEHLCPANLMNDMLLKPLLDPYEFRCNSDESNAADNYYYSWEFSSIFNNSLIEAMKAYLGRCEKSVLLPLQQPTVESLVKNPASENLARALREGFGLQWFANNSRCDMCEQSKGECAYSARTGQFNCYCPDKAYTDSCPPQEAAGYNNGAEG